MKPGEHPLEGPITPPEPDSDESSLAQLQAAQRKVHQLRDQGLDSNSQEVRAAVNRLMTLIRQAQPEVLVAFDTWAAAERQRRAPR